MTMSEISTAITATADLATKALAVAQRVALYEVRGITITASATDTMPAGNYQLSLVYSGRTVALSALTATAGTLTGTLSLSTTQLQAVFDMLGVSRLRIPAYLYYSTGAVLWARGGIDVWNNEYDAASTAPVAVRNEVYQGQQDITSGATSVTVSFSSLSVLATASVVGSVLLPSGATDGVAVVGVTFSTTAAVFELSGAVPSAGYKLAWMVAQ
jgi:hypothetical protein